MKIVKRKFSEVSETLLCKQCGKPFTDIDHDKMNPNREYSLPPKPKERFCNDCCLKLFASGGGRSLQLYKETVAAHVEYILKYTDLGD